MKQDRYRQLKVYGGSGLVLLVSFAAAWVLPTTEFFKGLAAVPGVGALLNVILQLSRMSDGTRKVVTVSEVTGMEGEVVVMQDIFVFEKRGLDRDGKVAGEFRATGVRPKFLDAVHASGIHLPSTIFAYRKK